MPSNKDKGAATTTWEETGDSEEKLASSSTTAQIRLNFNCKYARFPYSFSRRSQTKAKMAAEFERLSKLEYWKLKKDSENWSTMLAELRTTILMTQRQVNTRSARAKELMTSGHKDSLVTVMTVLEDLCDLEATVIVTYVTALKTSSDPETLALIEAETTASKEFATTT